MPVTELFEPVVENGIRLTNFFNGRVLTAEDLKREQDAARGQRRQLARAVGEGVLRGFEVRIVRPAGAGGSPPSSTDDGAPLLRIEPGLAFNRDGDAVQTQRPVDLRLVSGDVAADEEAGLFALCQPLAAAVDLTRPGFYLLTARPASAQSRDRVSAADLSSEGVGTRCGARYVEEGASFSLTPFPLTQTGVAPSPLAAQLGTVLAAVNTDVESGSQAPAVQTRLAKNLSKLRSGVAYFCLGADRVSDRLLRLVPAASGSIPAQPASPLDAMYERKEVATCDVPIALLFVSKRRVEFVDAWAVRRIPSPAYGPDALGSVSGERTRAEAAAMFYQFRDHLSSFLELDSPAAPHTVKASEWFLFLPPAGFVPLRVTSGPAQAAGFVRETFFDWLHPTVVPPARPVEINVPLAPKQWAQPLLRAALDADLPMEISRVPRPRFYRFQTEAGDPVDWENRYLFFAHDAVR